MRDPRSEYFGQLRHEAAPPNHIVRRRMAVLTLAVLSHLHAREWFSGVGTRREEAEFYARAAA
jgi:hypothetical protein